MNVMLNIPVETEAGCAGRTACHSDKAEADGFRALFDQVAEATTADQRRQAGSAIETQDIAAQEQADLTQHRVQRDGGDGDAHGATWAAERREADSSGCDDALVSAPTGDTEAACPAGPDTVIVPAEQRPAARANDTALPADAPADQAQHPTDGVATDPAARKDPVQHDRRKDSVSGVANSAVSFAAGVAVPPDRPAVDRPRGPDRDSAGDSGAREAGAARLSSQDGTADPNDQRNIKGTGRAADDVVAVQRIRSENPDDPVKPEADKGTRPVQSDRQSPTSAAKQQRNSTAASASLLKPAAASLQPDPVRPQVHNSAVTASAADDHQPHGASDAPRAQQRAPSPRQTDQPTNVRVTAYERHLAPLAPAAAIGKAKAVVPDGIGVTGGAPSAPVSAADDVVQDAAGPVPKSRASGASGRREEAPPAGRDGPPATAKVGPGQRVAAQNDRVVMQDNTQHAEHGQRDGRQNKSADPIGVAKHAGTNRQTVTDVANSSGTQPAGSAPPAASNVPLTAGVASSIVGALDSARAAAPQSVLQATPAMEAGGAAEVVRTVALNLDMREHGQIDLRVSLKGNTVRIHLRADRPETVQALARDNASLRDLLHRAGYDAQQVQIDRRDAAQPRLGDSTASGQQQPAGGTGTGTPSGHAASGHAGGDQRGPLPQQRPQAQGGAFVLQDQDTHDAPRQDRYRGPDRLYV